MAGGRREWSGSGSDAGAGWFQRAMDEQEAWEVWQVRVWACVMVEAKKKKRSSLTRACAGDGWLRPRCCVCLVLVGAVGAGCLWHARQRQCRVVGGLAGGPIRPAPSSHQPPCQLEPVTCCPPCTSSLPLLASLLLKLAPLGAQTLRGPSASLRMSLRSHTRRTQPTTSNLKVFGDSPGDDDGSVS